MIEYILIITAAILSIVAIILWCIPMERRKPVLVGYNKIQKQTIEPVEVYSDDPIRPEEISSLLEKEYIDFTNPETVEHFTPKVEEQEEGYTNNPPAEEIKTLETAEFKPIMKEFNDEPVSDIIAAEAEELESWEEMMKKMKEKR